MTDLTEAHGERFWWDGLTGDEVEWNTAGNPPYDVDAAATLIKAETQLGSGFGRALDLGCGVGRLTARIAESHPNLEITGVDIAPTLLAQAKRRQPGNVLYRLGDGRNLPEACGHFNLAWSITVFQHIPHDAQRHYLRQVHDHLWPGARFVFTFSEGDEEAFLSHQTRLLDMIEWATRTGFHVERYMRDAVVEGWTWITARKGQP